MYYKKLPIERFTLNFKEIEFKDKNPKNAICEIANKEECSLILLGSFGRKGSK